MSRDAATRAARCTLGFADAAARLPADAWRWYAFLWTWTAARHSGHAGTRHARAWDRLGSAAYWRRIERVRRMWEGLKHGE